MAWYSCFSQRMSKLLFGIIFSLMGLGAVIIGVTVFPIFGLLVALLAFSLAFYFFRAHLSRQCEIAQPQ